MDNTKLRSRNFCFVTYASEDSIKNILSNHICKANYIEHSFDEGKQPHTHIVLRLKEATTASAVLKWFDCACNSDGELQNTLCEVCNNVNSSLRYLIHLDNSDKFQYSVDDVRSYGNGALEDFDKAISLDNPEYDSATRAVLDMLDGLKTRELVLKYGRDFVYHFDSICKVVSFIRMEEKNDKR